MSNVGAHHGNGGDLVIVGAGGFGRETAQVVHDLNQCGAAWRLLGYLDDNPARHGTAIDGTTILGGRGEIRHLPDVAVVVCTGHPGDYVSRMRIVNDLGLPPERYATIVHPTVAMSASSSIGHGCVVLAHVTLTAAVRVGAHVAIMPQVTLTHDNVIEDFATLASGARLGGGVRVQRAAYLGAGALIRENRTIGAFSLVGMGAVVTRDVPARQVWAGVPARYLRDADAPSEPFLGKTQLADSSGSVDERLEARAYLGRGRLRPRRHNRACASRRARGMRQARWPMWLTLHTSPRDPRRMAGRVP
jgi:sugar O-acyltransferase (sialic acid O-acetyltransferase NeuD family)